MNRKVSWKKRLRWAAGIVAIVIIGLFIIVLNRFNFSYQRASGMAEFQQWLGIVPSSTAQANVELNIPIIGHRGSGLPSADGSLTIGNTLTAIRNGIKAGADWIEIDVRRSSDGVLVVFHDETIQDKTTGKGRVSKLTIEAIQKEDIRLQDPEKIPTLDEVFQKFGAGGHKWIFDIKETGLREQLLPWIEQRFAKEQVMLFGTYDVLDEYKDVDYRRGYTVIYKEVANRFTVLCWPSSILQNCEYLDCDILVLPMIFANQYLIDGANQKEISVWTYDSEDARDWRHCQLRGIGGLIVDDVPRAKELTGTSASPQLDRE
jgi:glycerophosphoryl diester phosphodiesterase